MKNVSLALGVLGVLLAGGRSAFAGTGNPGSACRGAFGGDQGYVDTLGLTNVSGSDDTFECLISVGTASNQTVSSGWFNFQDESTTDPIQCTMYLTNTSGSQWFGATRYSCSTGGGCADLTTTFTGNGWIGWGGSTLPSGAAYTMYNNSYTGYECTLPVYGASYSYIFAYGVN
jgi:hypothetical protein